MTHVSNWSLMKRLVLQKVHQIRHTQPKCIPITCSISLDPEKPLNIFIKLGKSKLFMTHKQRVSQPVHMHRLLFERITINTNITSWKSWISIQEFYNSPWKWDNWISSDSLRQSPSGGDTTFAPSEESDHTVHMCSLIMGFAIRMKTSWTICFLKDAQRRLW